MQYHRSNAERLDPRRSPRAYARVRAHEMRVVTLSLSQLRYSLAQLLIRAGFTR